MNLFFKDALLPQGWERDVRLLISDGKIVSVVSGAKPTSSDECHALGLPGVANVHSHGFQRSFAGLTEQRGPTSDSFWTWRDVMYRFVGKLNPDDVEALTAQAYVEMLEAGFVHVGEFHYLHHEQDGSRYADRAEMATRIAAAAQQSGIGLTLLPVFYAHSGFGALAPNPAQARFISDLDGFSLLVEASRKAISDIDGAQLGVAPHSLRAVQPHELAAVISMAKDGPIHIHVAEQIKEVEDCMAWSGARPVQWLMDHAPVDDKWCLIHATHMTAQETGLLAASRAIAGLCPVTEANLGDGVFAADEFQMADGRYGVGTDSNVCISLSGELRQLEYSQRLTRHGRNLMATQDQRSTGRALYEAALAGGSQAAGTGKAGLCEGAPADIVSLSIDDVALVGRHGDEVLDSWIFAGGHGVIDCVWVRGLKRVESGRHPRRDEIGQRFRRVMKNLLAR